MRFCPLLLFVGLGWQNVALCLMKHELEEHLMHTDRPSTLRYRSNDTNESVPITGISGGPQARLEIRQLQNNTDAWNIYLLGSVNLNESALILMFIVMGLTNSGLTTFFAFPQDGLATKFQELELARYAPYMMDGTQLTGR